MWIMGSIETKDLTLIYASEKSAQVLWMQRGSRRNSPRLHETVPLDGRDTKMGLQERLWLSAQADLNSFSLENNAFQN